MIRLLLTLILLLGTIVIGIFYLRPAWARFQGLRTDTSNLQASVVELDQLLENRDILLGTINRISRDDLRRINQTFPQGPHAAELLVLLEGLASKNGIALRRVDLLGSTAGGEATPPGQPRPSGAPLVGKTANSIQDFPLTLLVNGSYTGLKGFLRDLEHTTRVIRIEGVSFAPPAAGTGSLDITVTSRVFYQE